MTKARFVLTTKNARMKMALHGSAVGKRKPQDIAGKQHGKSHK